MGIGPWMYVALFIIGAGLFGYYIKIHKFFRCVFFTATTGLSALAALWVIGRFIAIPLAITPLNIFTSGVLGIPGVLSLLILNLI